MNPNIICIDAEFTEGDEMLELSAYSLDGVEVYHSYYRPVRAREWRTDIHHITPEMVRDEMPFGQKRREVETLLSAADAITGFAVDNDLRILRRNGVNGLDELRVIDVRDMFWYMHGRNKEMNPFSVPSLLVCANELGLDFGADEAHSASADTEATLRCFNHLMSEFNTDGLGLDDAVTALAEAIEEARADFVRESSRGFVKVLKAGDVYKIRFGRHRESQLAKDSFEVEVEDRYKAEYEVRKLLKKREVPGKTSLYKLGPKHLADLQSYTNEYDAEESAWCKKVVRNLSRLNL